MNDIVNFKGGGAIANLTDMADALADAQSSGSQGTFANFIKMDKSGDWSYGAEGLEVSDDSRWAFNPASLRHGWVCWQGDDDKPAEKLGEKMVSIYEETVLPRQPEALEGGSWAEQWSMEGVCIAGEDKDVEVEFSTTSIGGLKALKHTLLSQIIARAKEGKESVPIIELTSDHYKHPKYGKTYNPVLNVTGWAAMGDTEVSEADEKPAKKAAAPAKRSRKPATEPAEEPAAEAEAPARRRRKPVEPEPEPEVLEAEELDPYDDPDNWNEKQEWIGPEDYIDEHGDYVGPAADPEPEPVKPARKPRRKA